MLDKDRDNMLSSIDILKFVSMFRRGFKNEEEFIKLFPLNAALRLTLYDMKRGDQINLQQFSDMVHECPYTVFPAFRFQDQMQE